MIPKPIAFSVVSILALAIFFLQVQSSSYAKTHNDIAIIQEEISFLEKDIAHDSAIVTEFLQAKNEIEHKTAEDKKQHADTECDERKTIFENNLEEQVISYEEGVVAYRETRDSHADLEEIKNGLITTLHENEEENIEVYKEKKQEVTATLAETKKELLKETNELSKKNSLNSIFTISATILMGIMATLQVLPVRRKRQLSKKEEQAMNILRTNETRNVTTTIKDIKKGCNITHPTAQTLVQNLEEKKIVYTEKNGRERHLFRAKF